MVGKWKQYLRTIQHNKGNLGNVLTKGNLQNKSNIV